MQVFVLKRLTIWIDAVTLKKLKEMAKAEDRSVGWIIRRELMKAVEKQ
jgi:predicted transcriptional regulator